MVVCAQRAWRAGEEALSAAVVVSTALGGGKLIRFRCANRFQVRLQAESTKVAPPSQYISSSFSPAIGVALAFGRAPVRHVHPHHRLALPPPPLVPPPAPSPHPQPFSAHELSPSPHLSPSTPPVFFSFFFVRVGRLAHLTRLALLLPPADRYGFDDAPAATAGAPRGPSPPRPPAVPLYSPSNPCTHRRGRCGRREWRWRWGWGGWRRWRRVGRGRGCWGCRVPPRHWRRLATGHPRGDRAANV